MEPSDTSWAPVDLEAVLDGDDLDPRPQLLTRSDAVKLLYPGRRHAFAGEPESCKTWLALLAVAEVLTDDGVVLYLDFEDNPASVVHRLLALGVKRDHISTGLAYVRPDSRLDDVGRYTLDQVLDRAPRLVVVDGVTEALATFGLDLTSNSDIAQFAVQLTKPLADTGAAVLELDHLTKSRDGRGRYAIGAQHKLAGLDGAAYLLEIVQPFGHGRTGRVRVLVAKDRLGRVREHAGESGKHAGTLLLRSSDDGTVIAEARPARRVRRRVDAHLLHVQGGEPARHAHRADEPQRRCRAGRRPTPVRAASDRRARRRRVGGVDTRPQPDPVVPATAAVQPARRHRRRRGGRRMMVPVPEQFPVVPWNLPVPSSREWFLVPPSLLTERGTGTAHAGDWWTKEWAAKVTSGEPHDGRYDYTVTGQLPTWHTLCPNRGCRREYPRRSRRAGGLLTRDYRCRDCDIAWTVTWDEDQIRAELGLRLLCRARELRRTPRPRSHRRGRPRTPRPAP